MSEQNLFNQLSQLTRTTTKIALAPGERIFDQKNGQSYSLPKSGVAPIVFEVHSITPNEAIAADAVITAKPPEIFEDHPNPKGMGMVRVQVGYDELNPEYVKQRQAQLPLRDAYIALMGCPALRETTPGKEIGIAAQASHLLENMPAFVLEFLALNIERISIFNVVGNEEVERFLAEGSDSTNTKSSKSSGGRSQAKKKKQPSKRSTGRTSTTK